MYIVYKDDWPVFTGSAREVAAFLGATVGNVFSRASRLRPRHRSGVVRVALPAEAVRRGLKSTSKTVYS